MLRVELPDVPGSLGALATALGSAGADIEAIEIIEHRGDGKAVDDVLLELPPSVMPDALVTACHKLDGVRVQWVSRYNAGANLTMDLETVEAFTNDPSRALESLVDLVPATFRADWAMSLRAEPDGDVALVRATDTAPQLVAECAEWLTISRATLLPGVPAWESTVLAGARVPGRDMVIVLGRHGGPEVLGSELARLDHLTALAASVSASA
ncbi:ACT domain-containing protein [Solicola sp. PLA-1-18]|uniref:ACT domain-containing protein n=1 Tax=Solicola sp. PLA-1-18 TaxID=3380532 RepID=UPI003B81696D